MFVIGTSGWQYDSWKSTFYPPGLPQRSWLEFYSDHFPAVEVNNTFYRLPKAETFADWERRTPPGFVFVCKLSRYLTHVKRLRDASAAIALFMERSAPLGAKRGPFLMQLPPDFQADLPRLEDALDSMPPGARVAVEPRHDTWFDDAVYDALARRNAALCLADRRSRPVTPVVRTADWGYVRFHEGRATPNPCYGEQALSTWRDRLHALWAEGEEVWAFFNNDPGGCAVRDAQAFARLVSGTKNGSE